MKNQKSKTVVAPFLVAGYLSKFRSKGAFLAHSELLLDSEISTGIRPPRRRQQLSA